MKAQTNRGKAVAKKPAGFRPGYYRGIKLLSPAVPPTRPIEEIERAVEAAVAKALVEHPELFARD